MNIEMLRQLPITGVYSVGDVAWEWLLGDESSVTWDVERANARQYAYDGDPDDEAAFEEWYEEYSEMAMELPDPMFYGGWKWDEETKTVEPDEESDFAFIAREQWVQVVWSKRICIGRMAFQGCFPGQADARPEDREMEIDMDNEGSSPVVAYYALPEWALRKENE